MIKLAILATMEAKPGKEEAVAEFLASAKGLVEQEAFTVTWFAIRTGKSTFAIFDAFDNEAGRNGHLTGQAAAALMASAKDLFVRDPVIEKADLLAFKLPA